MARRTASLRSSCNLLASLCVSRPGRVRSWHSSALSAKRTSLDRVTGFNEVADRVWVARYPWLDVNVSVVAGEAGLLVLDTQASAALAREVVADLRRVSSLPVLLAVNSHEHWDHTFGNGVLQAEGAELDLPRDRRRDPPRARRRGTCRRLRRRTTRAGRRSPRPRSSYPSARSRRRSRSTWATASSSWSTPAAATRAATWSSACPTPTCCSPATWSSRPTPGTCRPSAPTATRWSGR